LSSPRQLLSTRAKIIGGLGALALAGLAIAAGRRGSSVDPLHGEPTGKAASHASAASNDVAPPEQDFSDKRWKQRAEERASMRDAAPSAQPAPGVGAEAVPGQRERAAVLPGTTQPNAPGAPQGGTLEAGLRVGPNGTGRATTSSINTRVEPGGAPPPSAATPGASQAASRGTSGSSSPSPVLPTLKGLAAPGCGDGVRQAGELCEPAGTPKCGDDCTPVVSDACYDCEVNSRCVAVASACTDFMTSKLDESLCYDVAHCIEDTGCAAGDQALTACFCGDMTTEQCVSAPDAGDHAPHGACADVIRDAMGLGVSNAYVLTHYTTRSVPAGAAIMRFQCLKNLPACAPLCFAK